MNRIDKCFAELMEKNEKALVCFLTCGDPDFETTKKLVDTISEAGADIIELGLPFSDPMADGPSIQAASFRALENGATVTGVLDCVREIRKTNDVPIVLMSYFNPVYNYGVDRFARDAVASGVDGVIMTDLTPEESDDWKCSADGAGLATIYLLAPTSTEDRIHLTANMASGFIYCVSRTGVTGAREDIPPELASLVRRIKAGTGKPVVVGFGISRPEHVKSVCEFADGAVVGSAIVNIIAEHSGSESVYEKTAQYVKELKSST